MSAGSRKPEDQAADDLLVDQEAERQDLEATIRAESEASVDAAVAIAVGLLKRPKPSAAVQAKALDIVVRATLLAIAAGAERMRELARRHARERKRVFAGRSGEKLDIEPITRKRIEARKAAIEEARKVADG